MGCEAVRVICYGNELHGDDGFGPAVWARLECLRLPAQVRVLRADVAGLASLSAFEECDTAIMVDALRGYGAPGSVHWVEADSIASSVHHGHGSGLAGVLALLPLVLARLPRIEMVGVEVAHVRPFAPGLSAPVAAAVERVAAQIALRVGAAEQGGLSGRRDVRGDERAAFA